jgi:hypothetical protein
VISHHSAIGFGKRLPNMDVPGGVLGVAGRRLEVKLSRADVGVTGELLDFLYRCSVFEGVRDRGLAK